MSNDQSYFQVEKPSIANSEPIEKFSQQPSAKDINIPNPKIEDQSNDNIAKLKTQPRAREQSRKKRDKRQSTDFQDNDSFDDLDYTLENDTDFERKMRSSYGRNRYTKSGSTSRTSRLSNNGPQLTNARNGFDSKSRKSFNANASVHSGWKPEEDARLKEAIQLYGSLDWMKISNFVGNGRTRSQCSQRWHRCLDPHISKEKWSEDEIECLKNLVNEYGDRSWARIASKMEKRCDVQCRYMYKRIANKKNIRGIHSENLNTHSKSENDGDKSSEKVDLSIDEFEREIENDENFGISNQQMQQQQQHGNLAQSNFFMGNQADFNFQQPNFVQPLNISKGSIFNNAFSSQNNYLQPNQTINNNNNFAAKSIFSISDTVFSLFESQKSNVFNNQKQNQNSETVIKSTPIDDFMAGISSSSSSSSFPSNRYKF